MKFIKIILILTILLGIIFYLDGQNIFKIRKIDLESDKITCAGNEEIKNESGVLGQQFFFLKQNLIKEKLRKKFICIKDVDLNYKFPNKLDLKITERKPALVVSMSFIVDEEGFVFARKDEEINIPKVEIVGFDIKMGAVFPDNIIKKSLSVFNFLSKISLNVRDAKISQERELIIISDMKIIFNLYDDIESKLASLQLILNQAKIESRVLKYVDLRFDKPVITYER